MAFRRFELTIEGTTSLICSNPLTVDTLGPHAIAIKYYTDLKKNRNEHALRRLHWLFSAYWGTEGDWRYGPECDGDSEFEGFSDPVLPATCLARCLRDGATAWKMGKNTSRGIVVEDDAKIIYDGPRDGNLLYENKRFISVARSGRGTAIVRIQFPEWRLSYRMLVNDDIVTPQILAQIADRCGIAEGIGTWRPGSPKGVGSHGRFKVVQLEEMELF
jgi:hypothetical protein